MRQLFVSTTAILLLVSTASVAQETSLVSFSTSADNTKYTQQHVIEVGDVPGHLVRVFAIRRTFPQDPPIIGGVALSEQLSRGLTDYIGNSGSGNFYGTYVLENGDKFFTRSSLVAHKAGSGLSAIAVGRITGGTGKFATMQGEVRTVVTSDPAAGINEGFTTIEYVLSRPEPSAKKEGSEPGSRAAQR
jgi:hypothetical protein